jgi:hypothetical protein
MPTQTRRARNSYAIAPVLSLVGAGPRGYGVQCVSVAGLRLGCGRLERSNLPVGPWYWLRSAPVWRFWTARASGGGLRLCQLDTPSPPFMISTARGPRSSAGARSASPNRAGGGYHACWRGPVWTRLATPEEQDLDARRIYWSAQQDWLDKDSENLVMVDWEVQAGRPANCARWSCALTRSPKPSADSIRPCGLPAVPTLAGPTSAARSGSRGSPRTSAGPRCPTGKGERVMARLKSVAHRGCTGARSSPRAPGRDHGR